MYKNENILITGASGFIGSNLAKIAINEGYKVYALIRTSSPQSEELKSQGVILLYGDLCVKADLENVFSHLNDLDIKINYVIHAAGLTKANSFADFINVNVNGTSNLLDALNKYEIKLSKLIFVSSLAASGPEELENVIKIGHQRPVTNYGKSKLLAENIVKSNNTIPYIIFRPTAVYGSGEKDLYTLFKLIKKGINPLIGFGEQKLTFINVTDLCRLLISALQSPIKNDIFFATDGMVYDKKALGFEISKALNKRIVTIKIPLTIVKFIALITEVAAKNLGKVSPLNLDKCKELSAESWHCDVNETFEKLNYRPSITLERGVRETIKWYKENNWI